MKINKPLLDALRHRGEVKGVAPGASHTQLTFDFNDLARKETQIFVLSPEVALAAQKMVVSSTFKLPDLSQLKFPYPHMAVEVPLTEDIKALRRIAPYQGEHPIKRIGLVIQANNEEGWVNCSPYWEYEDATMCECPLLVLRKDFTTPICRTITCDNDIAMIPRLLGDCTNGIEDHVSHKALFQV